MLRALTIAVAGLVTAVVLKRAVAAIQAIQTAPKPQPTRDLRPATRLKQDPATGVYYPEH
jgi:hypothetical protein